MSSIITVDLRTQDLSEVSEFEQQTMGNLRMRLYLLGFSDDVVKVGVTRGKLKTKIQSLMTVRRGLGHESHLAMASLTAPHINALTNECFLLNESGFTKAYGEYLRASFQAVNGVLYALDMRTEYTDGEKIRNSRTARTFEWITTPGALQINRGPTDLTEVN